MDGLGNQRPMDSLLCIETQQHQIQSFARNSLSGTVSMLLQEGSINCTDIEYFLNEILVSCGLVSIDSLLSRELTTYPHLACKYQPIPQQKKLDQLPAVDIQHAPDKLPSKLHIFAYIDFLAQSLCSVHSDCASKLG